jgi:peptide/nickel transport system substrate-binding protein
MNAFNTVYYSFSPQVADYERQQPWLQTTVKTGLYPLFGILLASEKVFSFAGGGETGTVLAGTTASSLIGAVYVFPAVMAATIAARKRIGNKALLAGLAATVIFLALTAVTLLLNMHTALIVSTSAFVVSAAATAALAMARAVAIVRAR